MAEYSKDEIRKIEDKWHKRWVENRVDKTVLDTAKPKYYVLDMFPYPSGVGLHVGHPLGYIASDIVARYKRIKGFNVLHPMGFDAFGLPAEQYAIEHGIHPAISTQENIRNYKRQMAKIGFSYDWDREVQTCDPAYYKWTQWIFLQIFDSWFNRKKEKAERISELLNAFQSEGNMNHPFPNTKFRLDSGSDTFSASDWKSLNETAQQNILMQYRLAYLAYTDVNWCEALGTVLANDEVINGVSYRGGFPVVKRQMRQWSLRITEYAERLLKGLDQIDFSDSMKEIQRNWIGKSIGAKIAFNLKSEKSVIPTMTVFTTRPETIFGVDFMVVAPEHEMVKDITSAAQQPKVDNYLKYVESRSEVERMAEVKKITGCFTGAFAINPFNKKEIPVWISEYVLAGYGTGAIMGVPCGDERDHKFAKHFDLPITNIIGKYYDYSNANPTYDAILEKSDFLNGLSMKEGINVVVKKLETFGIGTRQVNFKMRDAGWSRQRYWGEPFPVVFRNDIPYAMKDEELPLVLPELNNFKSPGSGEGPLANLKDWINISSTERRDSNTMPTHAGAAWYFLRYMDPHNDKEFVGKEALKYWGQVDVYVGGSEHAVAHLLYARLWTKILADLGYLNFDEPFKKLINQGKITGTSQKIYFSGKNRGDVVEVITKSNTYLIASKTEKIKQVPGLFDAVVAFYTRDGVENALKHNPDIINQIGLLHVDISLVQNEQLNIEAFRKWRKDFSDSIFFCKEGYYHEGIFHPYDETSIVQESIFSTKPEVEKMSKSKYNVVNPDEIIDSYGADTLRMYEMFLGPLEASKPWNTNGIDGVYKFLRRFWNLAHDNNANFKVTEAEPIREELKVLHKTLKKIETDIENFSLNTSVSEFMICVNELTSLKCNKRAIIEPLVIALSPFAPHMAEELWEKLGYKDSILNAQFPKWSDEYLIESSFNYPISINGKVRGQMNFAHDMPKEDIEKVVLASEIVLKWSEGKPPKKVIVVPGKIVNIVL